MGGQGGEGEGEERQGSVVAAVGSRWMVPCRGHGGADTSEDGGKEAVGQPKNPGVSSDTLKTPSQ